MNHNSEIERIIDLKDLLYRVARKWRSIVGVAIILALLAALYQVISTTKSSYLASAQMSYENAAAEQQTERERLQVELSLLSEQAQRQQEYLENSLLMKIDPMNEWVGILQLCVNTPVGTSLQNDERVNSFVSAYTASLLSADLFQALTEQIGSEEETRYVSELYSVETEPGSAVITVRCIGGDQADVQSMMEVVKEKSAEYSGAIRDAIGEHDISILTVSVYSVIDTELSANQKEFFDLYNESNESLEKTAQELKDVEGFAPAPAFGTHYTAKRAVKYLILGGVAGLFVMLCWYAARYVMGSTVKTDADWAGFGLAVFGRIGTEKKKRAFHGIDTWLDRLFGHKHTETMEQDCRLAAHNLGAMQQAQGLSDVTFVGCLEHAAADRIIQIMTNALPDIRFAYAGNVLTDYDTASNLKQTEKVFLLAENQKTRLEDVRQTMALLKAWGKTVAGVVEID